MDEKFIAGSNDASNRQSIDAGVDRAMSNLFGIVKGSRELVSKASGVLVFPNVIQAGFTVGGQYGEGALRVSDSTVGYYSTTTVSPGLLTGAESTALFFLFMTHHALGRFRAEDYWPVGADPSVALVKMDANGAIDAAKATAQVEVVVMSNGGMMADPSALSLQSTKVVPLQV